MKEGWECTRCGCKFTPKHATRALYHHAKVTNQGITVCKAIVPENYAARYKSLLEALRNKKSSRKRANDEVESYVEDMQNTAVASLIQRKNPKHPVNNNLGNSSEYAASLGSSVGNTRNTLGFPVVGMSSSRAGNSIQQSIDAAMESQQYNQRDIRVSNNSKLTMAIADFFHCNNVPDSVVEDPRFKRMIQLAKCVGSDYKFPNRKQIGGDLLDLNYKNTYGKNKEAILREALTFGMAWEGDGATIHRMPLMNVLCTTGVCPPTVVAVHDCTEHMAAGGKKDASYIAGLFEEYVIEFDKEKLCTDLFFFDGASNVQKAGEVLVAKFPRAYVLHGGEHVISLFFDDLSKLPPIRVRTNHFYISTYHLISHLHRGFVCFHICRS